MDIMREYQNVNQPCDIKDLKNTTQYSRVKTDGDDYVTMLVATKTKVAPLS